MNTSYIKLLQIIKQFADNHLQVKRFSADFEEQVDSYGNTSEAYPILYVAPQGNALSNNTNQFTITVYCFDLIKEGRQNINYILSDTDLILNDLYIWLRDGNYQHLDILTDPLITPINNFLLDYAAGNSMSITVEVESYGICEIPIEPIPPNGSCQALLDSLTTEQLNECILPSYNFANPAVFGNLTAQQLSDLTDELCGGGQPIDIYINGVLVVSQTTVDTYLYVQNSLGNGIGSWNGTEWVVANSNISNTDNTYVESLPAGVNLQLPDITVTDSDGNVYNQPAVTNVTCLPCPPCDDATVELNGTTVGNIASGGTGNFPVIQDGNPVGSWNGTEWVIPSCPPCDDASLTVNGDPTFDIPSGQTKNLSVETQSGTPIGTWDSFNEIWVVPDCDDATIEVNGDFLADVASGGTLDIQVVDSASNPVSVTLSGGNTINIPSLPCAVPSGIAYQGMPFRGDVTAYTTGDEGWQFVNIAGRFAFPTQPAYPTHWAQLDYAAATPFLTLVNNNVLGNLNRFTVHPSNSNIIFDHLHAVTWYKRPATITNTGVNIWNTLSSGETHEGITFYLPTSLELLTIRNPELTPANCVNYSPFNVVPTTGGVISCSWTNNANKGNTSGGSVGNLRRLSATASQGGVSNLAVNSSIAYEIFLISRDFNPI